MPRKKSSEESNAKRVANQKEKRRKISEGVEPVADFIKRLKKIALADSTKRIREKIKEKAKVVLEEAKVDAKALYDKTKDVPVLSGNEFVNKLKAKLKESVPIYEKNIRLFKKVNKDE